MMEIGSEILRLFLHPNCVSFKTMLVSAHHINLLLMRAENTFSITFKRVIPW